MTTNKAAERLRKMDTTTPFDLLPLIDAALAEERRYVIEQIREQHKTCTVSGCHVPAILDEVERVGRE